MDNVMAPVSPGELLDKITAEGISSLSEEEKAYLKQASQQYQGQESNRP